MQRRVEELRRVRSISIDVKIWEQAATILHEVGMSRSRFVELIFRQLVRSRNNSFADVTADIFQDVARAAVEKATKERTRK